MKEEFLYLCDGNACDWCSPECHHTSDLNYSLNFDHEPTKEEKRERFTCIGPQYIISPEERVIAYFEKEDYIK